MSLTNIAMYVATAVAVFILGFSQGFEFHKNDSKHKLDRHVAVCNDNKKYMGHAAYDTTGDPMCFQQSKLTGKIERVSLLVKGL